MADQDIAEITTITNCDPRIAAQYLQLADGDPNQAITLFFENGGADLSGQSATATATAQQSTLPQPAGYEDPNGVVHLDSDDEDERRAAQGRGQPPAGGNTFDSDLEMARRLQEEMYGGPGGPGGPGGGTEEDDIRAPIARQAQTLIGPDAEMDFPTMEDLPSAVRQQMRAIQQRRTAGNQKSLHVFEHVLNALQAVPASSINKHHNPFGTANRAVATSVKLCPWPLGVRQKLLENQICLQNFTDLLST